MFRKHWYDPRFWQWWWRYRASSGLKAAPAVLAVLAVAVGGYFAAGGLSGAFGSGSKVEIYETTVRSVQTVHVNGRTVRRNVPVVRRVVVTTTTRPDGAQVITRRVVSTVPVVRREVVTVGGASRTVVETRPGGVVTRRLPAADRTVTAERVVTDSQVVTLRQVVTAERTVTAERVVTVVQPVTQTVTSVRTEIVTLPVTITFTFPTP